MEGWMDGRRVREYRDGEWRRDEEMKEEGGKEA